MPDQPTFLDRALLYASHGIAVFPCEPRGKRPLGRLVPPKPDGTGGYHDATCDEVTIRAWWAAEPEANIGIPCGPNGWLVLDVDPRSGGDETLAALLNGDGPPVTPEAYTGGGGHHYLFVVPDWTPTGRAGPGLDVKLNGYIVVAPSVHPSGGAYRWAKGRKPWDLPLAPVPEWLAAVIRRPERDETERRAPVSPAPAGDRLSDREVAVLALAAMRPDRADEYESWIAVGMACRTVADDLLPDWIDWSKQSARFTSDRDCEQHWRSFDPDPRAGVSIGSLVAWAREDGSDLLKPGSRRGETMPASTAARSRTESYTEDPAEDSEQPASIPESLADFGERVDRSLSQRTSRATKQNIAKQIAQWALDTGRLLWDPRVDRGYLLDSDRAVPLSDDHDIGLWVALRAAGINPTEPAFKWVLAELVTRANEYGERRCLARWTHHVIGDATIYASCGDTQIVRCRHDGARSDLEVLPNGTDGILFARDACLPTWETKTQFPPLDLPALSCPLQSEGDYTASVQRALLRAWLLAVMAGLRPLPILAALGSKGSGKTTLGRAVVRLLMAEQADVLPLTADERDFDAVMGSMPAVAFDNVDAGEPPPWLADRLAMAVTGGTVMRRALYQDARLHRSPLSAAIIVTSRTAAYARPDVAERTLPMLTDELQDGGRLADSELSGSVYQARSACLTWLIVNAAELLHALPDAPRALPGRFVDFARLVWADAEVEGEGGEVELRLRSLRQAQATLIGEGNPLLEAILALPVNPDLGYACVYGTPTEIIRKLNEETEVVIPHMGGGKAVARHLRELSSILRTLGWSLRESRSGNAALFDIQGAMPEEPEKPENAE